MRELSCVTVFVPVLRGLPVQLRRLNEEISVAGTTSQIAWDQEKSWWLVIKAEQNSEGKTESAEGLVKHAGLESLQGVNKKRLVGCWAVGMPQGRVVGGQRVGMHTENGSRQSSTRVKVKNSKRMTD